MSFILDALKKSESERQRKGAPGIADVPHARDRSHGARWAWIIGALLAVNLTVLVGLLFRTDTEPSVLTEVRPEILPPAVPIETPSERFSEIVADVKRSQPAPAPEKQPPLPSQTAPGPGTEATSSRPATVIDGLSTFNALRSNGSLQLPDLHLDIHVYSSKPAERFVFINMSRYRENGSLSEGPRIIEITADGVILEHLGLRFLLPRE